VALDGLDPTTVQTREDLAHALTVLRHACGLTVRDLARRVDAPAATLGDYFAGRHLPGPRQFGLYRSILAACGVAGSAEQEEWVAALNRARFTSDGRAAKGAPPYPGLDPFGEQDAELFFGRQSALDDLVGALSRLVDDPEQRPRAVVLVGPSGSGKTSLLMAGLLPAVSAGILEPGQNGPPPAAGEHLWDCIATRPEGLAAVAAGAGANGGGNWERLVVVVDQFEDALSLDGDARVGVFQALDRLYARGAMAVLGLRADFYQAAAAEPALLGALRSHQVLLGPMTAEELRDAVEGPAAQTGAAVEDGLVDLILADLAPGSPPGFAHPPGALPLLSYALLATWQRGGRNHLTIADYRAVGGIRGAVRQAAEELYGELDGSQQELARRIFSRLVRLDAAGPPTRRRAPRAELADLEAPSGSPPSAGVLERFVAARLLTVDADSVQISHDALLLAWPRLAEWIDADRDWLRLHTQLADAAQAWVEAGRDESLLMRGTRLEAALEQLGDGEHRRQLNRSEADFVDACVSHRDQQARAARRRTRLTHRLLGAVTLLAVASIVFAVVAVDADHAATTARNQALSRQVAIEAQQLQPTDPSLAAQLALAAYRISPTVQARSTLVDATSGEIPTRLLGPVGPEFVSLSPSGHLLAVAQSATDTVAVYRMGTSTPTKVAVVSAGPPADQDFAVALSPDGRLLAAGGTGHALVLWQLGASGRPLQKTVLRGFSSTVYAAAFSPDGQVLAAAGADGTLRRWDVSHPARPVALAVLHSPGGAPLKTVAYSPDGRLLAAAGGNGVLAVWPSGATSPRLAPGSGTAAIETLAFSPDGSTIVTGGDDLALRVWDVSAAGSPRPARPALSPATSQLFSVAFSPHGRFLAVGSADGSIHLYDTGTWAPAGGFGAPNPVTSVAFAPGGNHLLTADSGGVTRVWSLPDPATYSEPGRVYYLGYAEGSARLIAGSSGPQGDATVWDVEGPIRLSDAGNVVPNSAFGPVAGAVASSPDGRLVAVANAQAQIQIFDTSDPSAPKALGPPLSGNKPFIEQLGFSPDGRTLAASDDSGQVRMWNVADPSHPRPLPTLTGTTGEVLGFAFSNNGRLIATASTDDKVRLYDISHLSHPSLLATLGGFTDYAYDTAFTPDGRTLIGCSADGTIRIWDIANPRHPEPLGRPLTGPTGYVYAISVSPDGKTLAAAITTHAVWLWNISDPAHPRLEDTLTAGQAEAFAVAFSPDGRSLVASGSDDTLHLWQYRPADAEKLVCSLAGDPITPAEWARYIQAPYHPPCP